MKSLYLSLILFVLTAAAIFAFGRDPIVTHTQAAGGFLSGCEGEKLERTSNGVQVRLEICGSDLDGYDIDASNATETKWECTYEFVLRGDTKEKDSDGKYKEASAQISRKNTVTVSDTRNGWYNAQGESGIKEGRNFRIASFTASCSK